MKKWMDLKKVRIYPGADFEIRSKKKSNIQSIQSDSANVSQHSIGKDRQSKPDTMEDIRSVISKIDQLRDRSK
ncbi:hypothetical protein [Saccharicrinis fermentans]|uniref:Uncharacterized protein n=1 Tax=Saccharicrinis fermentans DSM 9555 = JCM 21142 TaxID=869213 RepID=W7Y546_9BACT|nr:hypothetical protein [Saccharicrinis fermentans]GAF02668.1 hypothetical protein JCM21142_31308 [Saccharicrinis fermentans DSM 9555 = JCM 21142]